MRVLHKFLRVALTGTFFTSACGSTPVGPSHTPESSRDAPAVVASLADLCDPFRPCLPDYGVCVRCDEFGEPIWVWSDAPGSPTVLQNSPNPPECSSYTFDDHGRPVSMSLGNERARYIYNDAGRIVRVERDGPRMCEDGDFGDFSECGPPDGVPDYVTEIRWSERDGHVVATVGPNVTFEWNERGQIVRRVTPSENVRFEYDEPAREIRRHYGDIDTVEHYNERGFRVTLESVRANQVHEYDSANHLVVHRSWWTGPRSQPPDQEARWTWTQSGSTWNIEIVIGDETIHLARTYNEQGRLVKRTLRNGVEEEIELGDDGRSLRDGARDYTCFAHLWPALTGS